MNDPLVPSSATLRDASVPALDAHATPDRGSSPSLPADSSGPVVSGPRARRQELQGEEHQAMVLRMRRGLSFGVFVWIAFGAVDWLVVRTFHVGDLGFFVALRALGVVGLLVALVRLLRTPPPSMRLIALLDLLAYGLAATLIAVMCVRFWGLRSPYGPGICLILVHRSTMAGDAWKRGLAMNLLPALSYPVVMLGATLVVPELAAQLHDPAAVTLFAIYLAFVFGTVVLLVLGGHIVWALRRQVFEARSIGRYKLKKRIGSGGMGDVWLAHHAALKRDVAVKILKPDARGGLGAVSRFEREVRATSELVHPNTVRVFDYGVTEDGLWYYAMELLSGETLAALVGREGPMPAARAIHLASQAARALGEAHKHGIVHRDVKPENLFVTTLGGEHDFVKVLDFGVARFFESTADATVTSTGWLVGTPAYMSPEAALGKPTDARADVYALGAVLYFMLAGRPPFDDTNAGRVVIAHVHERPEPPSAVAHRTLPKDVEGVVMRCLEKDPSARYASAGEVAAALMLCADAGKWLVTMARRTSDAPPPRLAVVDAIGPTLASPVSGAHAVKR